MWTGIHQHHHRNHRAEDRDEPPHRQRPRQPGGDGDCRRCSGQRQPRAYESQTCDPSILRVGAMSAWRCSRGLEYVRRYIGRVRTTVASAKVRPVCVHASVHVDGPAVEYTFDTCFRTSRSFNASICVSPGFTFAAAACIRSCTSCSCTCCWYFFRSLVNSSSFSLYSSCSFLTPGVAEAEGELPPGAVAALSLVLLPHESYFDAASSAFSSPWRRPGVAAAAAGAPRAGFARCRLSPRADAGPVSIVRHVIARAQPSMEVSYAGSCRERMPDAEEGWGSSSNWPVDRSMFTWTATAPLCCAIRT